MRVKCLQEEMAREYLERDRARGLYRTFTWLVEEVGELAEALQSGDRESAREEIADIIAWTVSIANILGIDVEEALRSKYGFLSRCP
ncbi:MAG: nucleotide pyrophosphohydrolase [Desulfurococcales archaeon]|nr:nucleotide pyrophosphohydrolase [Desulfurococcales archaeon]